MMEYTEDYFILYCTYLVCLAYRTVIHVLIGEFFCNVDIQHLDNRHIFIILRSTTPTGPLDLLILKGHNSMEITVNQILLGSEKSSQGSQEPRHREYFSQ